MTAVTDVPVLFALSGDPVELGVVKSLAQPGGNFTGTSFLSLELAGKSVELLKEVLPKLRTLAVLSNTNHPGEQSEWRATRGSLQTIGCRPRSMFPSSVQLNSTTRLERRQTRTRMRCSSSRTPSRWCIAPGLPEFAVAQRLPSMFGWSEYCEAGGLLSYGANQRATYFLACDLR